MNPCPLGRTFWVLLLTLVLSVAAAWARTTRRRTPSKPRDVVDTPSKRSVSRQKSRGRSKVAVAARSSRGRHRRRYRRVWTTSPFLADPTEGDHAGGEDPIVRQASVDALGPLNGSIVVVNPNSGRILAMVNQNLALGHSYAPCSTIKLPVALAALHEGVLTKGTAVRLGRRSTMTLTEALAHSSNPFFDRVGRKLGFEKLSEYAHRFGFGERAGWQIPGEQVGTFPEEPPRIRSLGRMCSFGEEISVTALQLAAFVSAVANGGTLYYLQHPRTEAEVESFQPHVKRVLDEVKDLLPVLREGMTAAVSYGTARGLDDPYDQVLGKTGTCSEGGTRLGWFASYETPNNPQLTVVVLLRGGRYTDGSWAAEIAGRVYRNLHERNYYAQRGLTASRLGPPIGRLTR